MPYPSQLPPRLPLGANSLPNSTKYRSLPKLGLLREHPAMPWLRLLRMDVPFAIGGRLGLSQHDKRCVSLKLNSQTKFPLSEVDYNKVSELVLPSKFWDRKQQKMAFDPRVRLSAELDSAHLVLEYPEDWEDIVYCPEITTAPEDNWEQFVSEVKGWMKGWGSFTPSMSIKMMDKVNCSAELSELVTAEPEGNKKCYLRRKPGRGPPFEVGKQSHPLFLMHILHHLQTELMPNMELGLEFNKLMVYGPGGHFAAHQDAPVAGVVGTLLVGLSSAHTGGVLEVKEPGGHGHMRFDFGKALTNDVVHWAAFFSDCEHQVESVESGLRTVLSYRILAEKKGDLEPRANYGKFVDKLERGPVEDIGSTSKTSIMRQIVNTVASNDEPVGFILRHECGTADPELLKGADRILYQYLRSVCKPTSPPRLYNILVEQELEENLNGSAWGRAKPRKPGVVYALNDTEVNDCNVSFVQTPEPWEHFTMLSKRHLGTEKDYCDGMPPEYNEYTYAQTAVVIHPREDLLPPTDEPAPQPMGGIINKFRDVT
ncbi:hypothetical protein BASA81_005774 [Batrachochytrium salamandrivorans]|nr:hypothetical protein BASA81_005774 [Batrachochytrium salamandrivorans]